MIIRGGENISPYEIEAVLASHPHVAEAVAFGVDDRKYGQVVQAAVVLNGTPLRRSFDATPESRWRRSRFPTISMSSIRSPGQRPARCSARGCQRS